MTKTQIERFDEVKDVEEEILEDGSDILQSKGFFLEQLKKVEE